MLPSYSQLVEPGGGACVGLHTLAREGGEPAACLQKTRSSHFFLLRSFNNKIFSLCLLFSAEVRRWRFEYREPAVAGTPRRSSLKLRGENTLFTPG